VRWDMVKIIIVVLISFHNLPSHLISHHLIISHHLTWMESTADKISFSFCLRVSVDNDMVDEIDCKFEISSLSSLYWYYDEIWDGRWDKWKWKTDKNNKTSHLTIYHLILPQFICHISQFSLHSIRWLDDLRHERSLLFPPLIHLLFYISCDDGKLWERWWVKINDDHKYLSH